MVIDVVEETSSVQYNHTHNGKKDWDFVCAQLSGDVDEVGWRLSSFPFDLSSKRAGVGGGAILNFNEKRVCVAKGLLLFSSPRFEKQISDWPRLCNTRSLSCT